MENPKHEAYSFEAVNTTIILLFHVLLIRLHILYFEKNNNNCLNMYLLVKLIIS